MCRYRCFSSCWLILQVVSVLMTTEVYYVISLVSRPHPPLTRKRVNLVTIERFLGCTDSCSILTLNTDYMLAWCKAYFIALCTHSVTWRYFIGLSKIKTVDSAQPRNRSIVTRPFSSWDWEGGFWALDYFVMSYFPASVLSTGIPNCVCLNIPNKMELGFWMLPSPSVIKMYYTNQTDNKNKNLEAQQYKKKHYIVHMHTLACMHIKLHCCSFITSVLTVCFNTIIIALLAMPVFKIFQKFDQCSCWASYSDNGIVTIQPCVQYLTSLPCNHTRIKGPGHCCLLCGFECMHSNPHSRQLLVVFKQKVLARVLPVMSTGSPEQQLIKQLQSVTC